jgi:NCAIR mutase (PurE)-related protein
MVCLLSGLAYVKLRLVGKFPHEQLLLKTLVRVCLLVTDRADEQWRLLNLLANGQGNRECEDESEGERAGGQTGGHEPCEMQHLPEAQQALPIEVRPDPEREERKGVPEIIFGETKGTTQLLVMTEKLLAATGRAIISRVRPEAIKTLREAFGGYTVRIHETARSVVIYQPNYVRKRTGGRVGMISAGTSDIPVAEEAALITEEMGCEVFRIYDVGVAGLHRLIEPLQSLLATDVDVIIVAAGMDGALPSVIAGLVPVPVIGLPTSIGYGFGGNGVAALLSMLQTCAPGLTVVNIDNGIGAGITAALIANRVARLREHHLQ